MYLTVGELRNLIEFMPDDASVCYQRIEDKYFEVHGWETEELIWQEGEKAEYIEAFSAHVTQGTLCINSHY